MTLDPLQFIPETSQMDLYFQDGRLQSRMSLKNDNSVSLGTCKVYVCRYLIC